MRNNSKYIWILHLSDFHIKSTTGENENLYLRVEILAEEWKEKIRKEYNAPEKPDLCLITGDITYSGEIEQYEQTINIIKLLENEFKLSREQIFVVPGNHDQKRNERIKELDENTLKTLEEYYSREPLIELKKGEKEKEVKIHKDHPYFILLEPNPADFSNYYNDDIIWNEVIAPRYLNFDHWLRTEFKHINFDDRIADCWKKQIKIKEQFVYLTGMNSAIASTGYKDKSPYVWLSGAQIKKALKKINTEDIIIAIMHHPWNCLLQEEQENEASGELLRRKAHIILTGHYHRFKYRSQDIEKRQAIILSTRALGDPEDRDNHGYNILKIDIDNHELTAIPRRWTNIGEFINDYDFIPEGEYPKVYPLPIHSYQMKYNPISPNREIRSKKASNNSKYDELSRCINDFIEKGNEDRMKLLRLINKYRNKEKDPQLKDLLEMIRTGLIKKEPDPLEQMKKLLKKLN